MASETFFVVGAVFCVPESGVGPQRTLRHTLDSARRLYAKMDGRSPPEEMHFSSGLKRQATSIMRSMINASYCDLSLSSHAEDLLGHSGLRFRTSAVSPRLIHNLGRRAMNPSLDIRVWALADIILPLLARRKEEVRADIVLDDTVWSGAANILQYVVRESFPDKLIAWEVADSRHMPGLQIADIISGVTRAHLNTGDYQEAFELLTHRTLVRLPEKAL